jgi:hypothetical protein
MDPLHQEYESLAQPLLAESRIRPTWEENRIRRAATWDPYFERL